MLFLTSIAKVYIHKNKKFWQALKTPYTKIKDWDVSINSSRCVFSDF
jgi:hypothetical protein